MSAGTLTLTNNSDAVSGAGTAFSNDLAAGDFIVVTVGGIPYTLPVKAINSNTSLTLVSNYTGPTQSGAAWSAITRFAMNLVTAALVAQSAEALRGLNYDKQNWQSIFSGTGNVTVRLPDGSSWAGPAWNGITTALNGKADKVGGAVPITQGGTGATTQAAALTALLGSSAVPVANGGTGATTAAEARKELGLAYGTTAGTVAQGNDTRMNTIEGKTGGAVNGGLKASTASPTSNPAAGVTTNSDLVGSRFRSGVYTGIDFSMYAQVVQSTGTYGIFQLSYGGSPAYWFFGQDGVARGTAWQPTCDERLKYLDGPIPDPLGKMKLVRGQTWKWKSNGAFGIGFTAQDVQKIFPEAVASGASVVLPDGSEIDGVLSPDTYGVAAALHHEAILALMDKNEAQQAEIAALKSDLEGLKKIVEQLIAQ